LWRTSVAAPITPASAPKEERFTGGNGLLGIADFRISRTETFSMAGHPSVPIIADAYLKGLTTANIEDLWTALTTTQSAHLHGFDQYMTYGYVFAGANTSVSTTQDYAFDDWATAVVGFAAKKSQSEYGFYLKLLSAVCSIWELHCSLQRRSTYR